MNTNRGYTLIELIVSIGLFALVMMLASGAYFIMINLNQQAEGISTGIDNLSFALDTMTRNIRTGTNYSSDGSAFSLTSASGNAVTYGLSNNIITQNGVPLTDPSVNISSLVFDLSGTAKPPLGYMQPYVTIIVSGTVNAGSGKTEPFTVETGAAMRGSNI